MDKQTPFCNIKPNLLISPLQNLYVLPGRFSLTLRRTVFHNFYYSLVN